MLTVENGNQLLADALGDGVQSCTRATGQYYSFHIFILMYLHHSDLPEKLLIKNRQYPNDEDD